MRIALWGAFDIEDSGRLAGARVLAAELRRRLPGAMVTAFAPLGRRRSLALDDGRPAEPIPDGPGAMAAFDCAVVCLGDPLTAPEHAASVWGDAALAAPLRVPPDEATTGCPVIPVDLPPDGAAVPPPLLLLPRLLLAQTLERRLDLQRLLGWLPESGPVVTVAGDARLQGDVDALARALRPRVDAGTAAIEIVVTGRYGGEEAFAASLERALGGRCRRVPGIASIDDAAAAVAASAAVLATPGPCLWLAAALGVPAVAMAAGNQAATVSGLGVPEVSAGALDAAVGRLLEGGIPAAGPAPAVAALDTHLDRLAGSVLMASLRRRGGAVPVSEAERTDAALRIAREALGRRLIAERHVLQSERDAAFRDVASELRSAREEIERLRSELRAALAANDAIVGSRTWRYTQPVRDTLARVRERRR
jgi:hypothetical protein